jgi:anti-sigma B factor antagonist
MGAVLPVKYAPMPNVNLQIQSLAGTRNGHKILRLAGALTLQTVFDFQSAVRAETAPILILDFSAVPYLDSSGLGAIIGAFVSMQRAQRKLALAGANVQVNALLDMTRVRQLLPAYTTVEEAEAALG